MTKTELISAFEDMTSNQPNRRNKRWSEGYRLSYFNDETTLQLHGRPVLRALPRYAKNGRKLKPTYELY